MSARKLEITLVANPDADDCLAEAAARHVAEYPDLAGWDLEPRWTDDTRETVTLTVPRWHYDDLQQNAEDDDTEAEANHAALDDINLGTKSTVKL